MIPPFAPLLPAKREDPPTPEEEEEEVTSVLNRRSIFDSPAAIALSPVVDDLRTWDTETLLEKIEIIIDSAAFRSVYPPVVNDRVPLVPLAQVPEVPCRVVREA